MGLREFIARMRQEGKSMRDEDGNIVRGPVDKPEIEELTPEQREEKRKQARRNRNPKQARHHRNQNPNRSPRG